MKMLYCSRFAQKRYFFSKFDAFQQKAMNFDPNSTYFFEKR